MKWNKRYFNRKAQKKEKKRKNSLDENDIAFNIISK